MAKKKAGVSERRKSFRCRLCGRSVRVPEGWTVGPAARRHYWRRHREVMQKPSREEGR